MSRQPRKKSGATTKQLALIGILSMILIGVLASQWLGSDTSAISLADPSELPGSSSAREEKPVLPAGESPFGAYAADEPWPEFAVGKVIEFDPFKTPDWAHPAPDVETLAEQKHSEEKLNELRNATNTIIITAGDKRIARIGKHEYQVGDTIGEFEITDISSAGVVLSKVD
jgi:hypothetical protein